MGNETTLDAVGPCLLTAAGEQAAREVLGSGADGDALWAAVWVYAASASDPVPLRPVLQSTQPSLAVMAAAALIAFGDASGFPVLQQSLSDTAHLAGSHPPMNVDAFALSTLVRYMVGSGLPPSADTLDGVPTAAAGWSQWLGSHAASLVFNDADGTWSQP